MLFIVGGPSQRFLTGGGAEEDHPGGNYLKMNALAMVE